MSKYRPVFYLLPLGLFAASAIPAVWAGYDPALALPTLAVLLSGGTFSAILSLAGRRKRLWDWAAGVFVVFGLLIAAYVLTQTGRLQYDEKVGLVSRMAEWISRWTPDLAFWQPNLNSVAVFLEAAPFLAVGLAMTRQQRRWKLFWLAAAAILLGGLLFSASRGAWLAVAAGALIWLALYWKPARWLTFACAGGMVVLIGYVLIRGDITAISDIPVLSKVLGPLFIRPDRLEVYRNSLALIADAPFTGIGLGDQFALVYSRYELLIPYLYLSYSHNLFLEVLLEQGLLGFAAWMGLVGTIFTAAWNHRHHPQHPLLEAAWVGIAVMLLHGVSDARPYDDLRTWLPFFVLVGLLIALLWEHPPKDLRFAWLLPTGATVISTLVFLALLGSLPAAFFANRGALVQQRADLQPDLGADEREALLSQAETLYLRALRFDPLHRPANQRLGMIYLQRFDFSAAISRLELSQQSDPSHPGTRKALGLAYAFTGKTEEALPLLQDLPNMVAELNYWGWFFDVAGQPTPGYNALVVSLAIEPDQPDIADYAEILRQRIPVNDL